VSGIYTDLIGGAPVNIWVQRDDLAAQSDLAARDGSDGIVEHRLVDERRGVQSLTALCDADLAINSRSIKTVPYGTRDVKTKIGKPVSFSIATPAINEALTIHGRGRSRRSTSPKAWRRSSPQRPARFDGVWRMSCAISRAAWGVVRLIHWLSAFAYAAIAFGSLLIDRTQYNLLADDDGSNTVGTVWNKNKVKTVLLDPIDTLAAPTTVTLADGATPALDASLAGLNGVFRLAAAGDRTIAVPTNATAGQKIIIQHYASGGSRTLSLNTGASGFRFGTDVTALTATASGKTDYIGLSLQQHG